jgi:hypothetical protein
VIPDDRHGKINTYKNLKCRCDACSLANRRYEKRRLLLAHRGAAPRLSSLGFQRRVRALAAIGHPSSAVADALGIARGNLSVKLRSPYVYRATHNAMCAIYDELCMTPRTDHLGRRTAARAHRNGWASPLAWDDIDTDEAPTYGDQNPDWEHSIDEAMVLSVINEGGRRPRRLTNAEARECVRILIDRGHNSTVINEVYGLQANRYFQIERGAA